MSRVLLHNPQHSNSLLQEANRMRLSGTLCDVVIRVDRQDFPAHSLVLACVSRTFETLFRTKSVRYSLDFLCSRTFQQILEYSYTDSLEAQTEELDDLLQAAGILAMEGLERQILVATSRAGETEGGDPGADGSVVRRSEGPPGLGAGRDGIPLARLPRRDAAAAAAGLRDGSFPSEKAEGGSPAGEEAYRCGVPETAQGRGPASAEPSRVSASELEGAGGPGSPDGRGAAARATGTPIHGTVMAAAARSVPSRQGRILQLGGGMKWPGHETLRRPYPAHRPLDARSFRALPAFLPPPVSQSPLAFSTTLDFGAFPSPPLQGSARPEFSCQPREEGNGLVLAGTARARGAGGNSVLLEKQAEEHQRLTEPMSSFSCESCGKRFFDSLRLRMHLQAHTGSSVVTCNLCRERLNTEEEALIHHRMHSGGVSVPLYLLCGKGFETHAALREHIATHGASWSYSCRECQRLFPSLTALKRHLKSHTGDPLHQCQFCRHRFQDETMLKSHKQIHQGEKPYQCSNCKKKFSLKHQLETHYRVHTGEKPFECKLCRQRSRDYSAMIKHLRTHNGALPYQCTVCREFCSSLSSMQKHMKSHKPEEIPSDWSLEETYLYLCYV